jgi:hypothetical protein
VKLMKMMMLGIHSPQSIACGVGAFVSRIELYNSDRIVSLFMFLYEYCYYYSLLSTICMKLILGIHIGMHLVYFSKTRCDNNALSALALSSRLSNHDGAVSGAGGAAWDVDASASCAGHCDITQPSDHTTSTSGAGSEAGPTFLLDRPLLGVESPPAGASTASRPLADGLSKRVCPYPWRGSQGTNASAVAAAASSCCGLAGRGHGVRRLASRHHTCRRPWHPLRAAPDRQ